MTREEMSGGRSGEMRVLGEGELGPWMAVGMLVTTGLVYQIALGQK